MKKLTVLLVALVLSLGGFAAVYAYNASEDRAANVKAVNALVALLPASDAVATVNVGRLYNDVLPQVLASDPAKLNKVNAEIEEFQSKTGINPRQFQQIAVGMKFNRINTTEFSVAPVAVARGTFNAKSLIALAKVAMKGKYREENVGANQIYVFQTRDIAAALPKSAPKPGQTSNPAQDVDKLVKAVGNELALTAYDNATLAFGNPVGIRSMLAGDTNNRVNSEIVALLNTASDPVMGFAGNVPSNVGGLLKVDNDEIGRLINSLRQFAGTVDVASGNAIVELAARTAEGKDAVQLEETLSGLQFLGSNFLGSRKDAGSAALLKVLENTSITGPSTGGAANEVRIKASAPLSELERLSKRK